MRVTASSLRRGIVMPLVKKLNYNATNVYVSQLKTQAYLIFCWKASSIFCMFAYFGKEKWIYLVAFEAFFLLRRISFRSFTMRLS